MSIWAKLGSYHYSTEWYPETGEHIENKENLFSLEEQTIFIFKCGLESKISFEAITKAIRIEPLWEIDNCSTVHCGSLGRKKLWKHLGWNWGHESLLSHRCPFILPASSRSLWAFSVTKSAWPGIPRMVWLKGIDAKKNKRIPAWVLKAKATSSTVNESMSAASVAYAFCNEWGSCLGNILKILVKIEYIDFYLLFYVSYGF